VIEVQKIYKLSPGESAVVRLPHGIGYVEIRTTGVNGPTGHPVIGVDVVSETTRTDAADGRRYHPHFDHDCGVVLVGDPGPKMLEQERFARQFAEVITSHDSGEHSFCPESCPALATTEEP
jgi:hypothetical protein